jgi:hypothetical protein
MKRLFYFDLLRGSALLFVVFFHTSVYNFANIDKLDFSHPPIIVVLISFLILWGGIFIIYSSVINSVLLISRLTKDNSKYLIKNIFVTGILLLIGHYLLTIVLGRWNVDFVHNNPKLTFVANIFRHLRFNLPAASKYFEGSSLSTIAVNLIVMSALILYLAGHGGISKAKRNYLILGTAGLTIMLMSFVRIWLFPLTELFISQKQYLFAWIFSFLIANPYPLVPYLAYGLFGAMLGIMFSQHQFHLIKKIIIPMGVMLLVYGFAGMTQFEKTISQADFFWYFKTHFELGIFLITTSIVAIYSGTNVRHPSGLILIPYWFSRICLTVYLYETILSEILRFPMFIISPSWNQTINGCLIYGGINVVLWIIILFIWSKYDFKYSLEYFWIKLLNKTGKKSTKLNFL